VSPAERARRLFHLVQIDEWRALGQPRGCWRPPSLATEGFVHLSFADQLPGTLALHFPGSPELALLELARAPLGEALVLETSRGAALFPHLYRAIALSELLGAWRLARAPGGAWVLPRLGGEGEPDRPAAQVWSDVLPAAGPG